MKEPKYKQGQALVKQYILDNRLAAGDALPSESDMAAQFGMSRLSIREALKGLETVGIVHTTHGGAVRVAEFSFQPLVDNLPYSFQASGRSFRELLELREALEEGLSVKALGSIRPRDLDSLEAIARAMGDADLASAERAELDRRFHTQLYVALDNTLVNQIMEMFWQAFHRMQEAYEIPVPAVDNVVAVHLAIVDALRTGDAAKVARSIRDHFAQIQAWVDVQAAADVTAEVPFDQARSAPR